MKQIIFFLLLTLLFSTANAQLFGDAPEIWSLPTPIKKLGNWPLHQSSVYVVPTNDTLYFDYGDIYYSIRSDSGWLEPVKLNNYINVTNLCRQPSLSPDGRRLYFSDWRDGQWDFWYSDWNDSTHDWSEANNMGPTINNWESEWSCHQVDDIHFYYHRAGGIPRLSLWDSSTGWWGYSQRLDTLHHMGVDNGISVPRSRKKIYTGAFTSSQLSNDLYVSYYDSASNQWSFPKRLNISLMMDTTTNDPYRRVQNFPSIMPNGKLIYFIATLNGPGEIWMSRLLFDENGNPVGIEEQSKYKPEEYKLKQNFPNPFNPVTQINFSIPEAGFVTLKVFDVLGREISELVSGWKEAGTYEVEWDGSRFSSGVYFYKLVASSIEPLGAGNYTRVHKMLLAK